MGHMRPGLRGFIVAPTVKAPFTTSVTVSASLQTSASFFLQTALVAAAGLVSQAGLAFQAADIVTASSFQAQATTLFGSAVGFTGQGVAALGSVLVI